MPELTWIPDHTGEQLWSGETFLGCTYQRPNVPHVEWRVLDGQYQPAGNSLQVERPGGSSDRHRLAARAVLEIHVYSRDLVTAT